jgi:hypothetical protein
MKRNGTKQKKEKGRKVLEEDKMSKEEEIIVERKGGKLQE